MRRVKKHFGFRTLKTAFGAIIAVFISQLLHLDYAANSGIIVILSVQATKKKSMDLAIMRIGSTVLALSIGTIVFSLLGFTAFAFGVYLLFFIPIAVKLKFHDGIVPCSVLVTHILSIQSVAFPALMNEMLQMLIGAGIGFLLNLYIPSHCKQIDKDRLEVDRLVQNILKNMADSLRREKPIDDLVDYVHLAQKIDEGLGRAMRESENTLRGQNTSYVEFFERRMVQLDLLKHMKRYFKRMYASYDQTLKVADLTELVSKQFMSADLSSEVWETFHEYQALFKSMPLPTTREEFENRASLYEYMNDLEHFLQVQ